MLRFGGWWLEGLCLPFPKRARRRWVLELSPHGIEYRIKATDRPTLLTDQPQQILRKARGTDAYLLVPTDAVISTGVPIDKRHLSPLEIASVLLPFEDGELMVAINSKRDRIYAVPHNDVSEGVTDLQRNGLTVTGVAFSDGHEFYCVELEPQPALQKTKLPWRLLAAILLAVSLAGASFQWSLENKRQDLLRQAMDEHRLVDLTPAAESLLGSQVPDVSYTADRIRRLLRNVADALPDGAEVDQVILNDAELLLDMRAPSGSLVRAEIDAAELFSSSEFVSAISADSNQSSERFRLKLGLSEWPTKSLEQESENE